MKRLIFFLFLLVSSYSFADEVKVVGEADSEVSAGARFKLRYTVNAAASDIILPDLKDFDILMGPSQSTSQGTTIVNGKVSTRYEVVFYYVLRAKAEGEYTIEPATVVSDGKRYKSNPVKVKVLRAGVAPSGQPQNNNQAQAKDIFIRQSCSKSSPYVGEPITVTLKLYTRVHVERIANWQRPSFADFFSVNDEQDNGKHTVEVVDGRQYNVVEIMASTVIPSKAGKLKVEASSLDVVLRKRMASTGSIFDDFFNDVQLVQQSLVSNDLTINAQALPTGNVPPSFNGAVGDFKFNMTVSPLEVDANNSVVVNLSVKGKGNMRFFDLPQWTVDKSFDRFDPTTKDNLTASSSGYSGTKSSEWLIIPRRSGEYEIPAVSFTYFDVSAKRYVTTTKGPFVIKVNKSAEGEAPMPGNSVAFAPVGENVQYVGGDLRYLRTGRNDLEPRDSFFVWSGLFFALTLIPLVVFVALFVVYRKKLADAANMSRVKMRKANKMATRRLKQAAKFIKMNKREAFFDEVMRALWGYLSDKLTLPLSVLTKDNAKEEMMRHNISSAVADEFMQLLDSCEFARYAPADISESMESVYSKAVDVIGKMEDSIK